MPGTHLLPPNLLKLFAPRPPLPYTRPLDRDIDRVHPKNVGGVGLLLAKLREEKTQGMLNSGEGEGMEEGEEPTFTHAEETKRALRREERKKKKTEDYKQAKETCTYIHVHRMYVHSPRILQTNQPMTQRLLAIRTRLCSSLDW